MTTSVQTIREAQSSVDAISLEEAVQQIINLGTQDPLEVARKIEARYDEAWLRDELYALREDIIRELARNRINGRRRSAMTALRKNDPLPKKELLLRGEWIPGKGWAPLRNWTVADLQARANYYRKIAGTALKLATWCEECIELMKAEEVETLGKLKADLPALEDDEFELVANGTV